MKFFASSPLIRRYLQESHVQFHDEINKVIHTSTIFIVATILSFMQRIMCETVVQEALCPETSLAILLRRKCPALRSKFRSLSWVSNPLIQSTLLHNALHLVRGGPDDEYPIENPFTTRREVVYASDGSTLAIEWFDRHGVVVDDDAPIMLHFPGLGQCRPTIGFGAMIVGAMQEHRQNARAVSVIYPGFAGHIIDSHKLPGSAYISTDDVGAILRHLKCRLPNAPIVLVGCSFGSAMVSNWLVRNADEAGACNIVLTLLYAYGHSTTDTVWAADNDALGGMTSASVVKMWKEVFLRNTQNLAHLQTLEKTFAPRFQIDALNRAKSVREWDIACLPLYGFESIDDMFRASDPMHVFRQLNPTIPVVIINADDDWICPSSRLLTANEMYGSMENVAIIETKGGGHLGWVDRLDVHKDRHYGRRRPLQIAYSLYSLFCGSPTITHEANCTGGHAIWITNLTMQIMDYFVRQ